MRESPSDLTLVPPLNITSDLGNKLRDQPASVGTFSTPSFGLTSNFFDDLLNDDDFDAEDRDLSPTSALDKTLTAFSETGYDDSNRAANNQQTFIRKLQGMLSNSEYSAIISWATDGKSILIHDVDKFTQQVMPHFFRKGRLSSFIRQLNMYGFQKIKASSSRKRAKEKSRSKINKTSGLVRDVPESTFEFAHPLFIYGRPDLHQQIRRKLGDSETLRIIADAQAVGKHDAIEQRTAELRETLTRTTNALMETKRTVELQSEMLRYLYDKVVTPTAKAGEPTFDQFMYNMKVERDVDGNDTDSTGKFDSTADLEDVRSDSVNNQKTGVKSDVLMESVARPAFDFHFSDSPQNIDYHSMMSTGDFMLHEMERM